MKKGLGFLICLICFSSCGLLNQSIMFKTKSNYQFNETPDYKQVSEYKLSPNDILVFDIYSNSGFNLINITNYSGSTSLQAIPTKTEYLVDAEGNVKFPVIGNKKIAGLTIRETENLLEESYSEYYNKPFVVAKVINRKVIYFTGNTSEAKVITLTDNNTTLLHLIAKDGGMNFSGKAKKVKLIRDVNGKHEVYKIDLSTINNIDKAHIVLQANDIVYVEPRRKVSNKALAEIAPIISLFSSSLIIIALLNNFNK